MTAVGQAITAIYSLLIITAFIILDLKRLVGEGKGGWVTIVLVPIFVLLINII